jgi:hypothetical protein
MKRTPNMEGMLEVLEKIHFSVRTLIIMQYLNIFQFNFGTKVYFCYFLVFG